MGVESEGGLPVNPFHSCSPLGAVPDEKRQGKLRSQNNEKKVSVSKRKNHLKTEAIMESRTSEQSSLCKKSVLGKRKFSQTDSISSPAVKLMKVGPEGQPSVSKYGEVLSELQKPDWIDRITVLSSLFPEKGSYLRCLQSPECRSILVSQIRQALLSSTKDSKEVFDQNIFFIGRLYQEMKACGVESVLKDIVQQDELRKLIPSIFQDRIVDRSGKSISPWDFLIPLCSFLQQHGEELVQKAQTSPGGFAKERGAELPCSIVAWKCPADGKVSLFVTGKILGQGAFKKVKQLITLGESQNLANASALKRQNQKAAFQDFQKEAMVSSFLRQAGVPYILKIWQASYGQKVRNISEICTGGTLRHALRSQSYRERMKLGFQTCEALAGMHKAGVVHLDLKLDNVFLTTERGESSIRVGDFGMAQKESTRSKPVFTGLCGTFPPPEML